MPTERRRRARFSPFFSKNRVLPPRGARGFPVVTLFAFPATYIAVARPYFFKNESLGRRFARRLRGVVAISTVFATFSNVLLRSETFHLPVEDVFEFPAKFIAGAQSYFFKNESRGGAESRYIVGIAIYRRVSGGRRRGLRVVDLTAVRISVRLGR